MEKNDERLAPHMKTKMFLTLTISILSLNIWAQSLPSRIDVTGADMHVQGVVVDTVDRVAYFSFTNTLLKTDFEGKVLASIINIPGHLGDLTYDAHKGIIYGSLECKDDVIGKGIAAKMKGADYSSSHFYVAMIHTDRLTRIGMSPCDDNVLGSVELKEVAADYNALAPQGPHRHGCSGIDGITLLPGRKPRLLVAYGIYGDTKRTDNDCQVILEYDPAKLAKYERFTNAGEQHFSGPTKGQARYFVYTGNTEWGVQNMEYDPWSGRVYMAVYRGKKKNFPNYSYYAFDAHGASSDARGAHGAYGISDAHGAQGARGTSDSRGVSDVRGAHDVSDAHGASDSHGASSDVRGGRLKRNNAANIRLKPQKGTVTGVSGKVKMLPLSQVGLWDDLTGIRGWNFKHGSTGFHPLGDGRYYISRSSRDIHGRHTCSLRLETASTVFPD